LRVKKISSEHNPIFKRFLKLKEARGIKKFEMALLSGQKYVKEALEEFPQQCLGIITYSLELLEPQPLGSNLPVYLLRSNLFRALDKHNTKKPILAIKAPSPNPWVEDGHERGCVLFLPFQDPANIGAAIRSGAAFGVNSVVLLSEAAHPFHPKSLRASGTSVFRVKMRNGPSISELFLKGLPLLVLDPRGKDISNYTFPDSFGLLAGLEGPGIPDRLRGAQFLSIPIDRKIESLNAALAVGIALYQWRIVQLRAEA